MQRQVNQTFASFLTKMQRIVHFNMQEKAKSDEQELFYGKFGANSLLKPPSGIAQYQTWVDRYLIRTGYFVQHFLHDQNLEILNELHVKNDPKLIAFLSPEISELVRSVHSTCEYGEFNPIDSLGNR